MTCLDCLCCIGVYERICKNIFNTIFFIFFGTIAIGSPFIFIAGLIIGGIKHWNMSVDWFLMLLMGGTFTLGEMCILCGCLRDLYISSRLKNNNQSVSSNIQVVVNETESSVAQVVDDPV